MTLIIKVIVIELDKLRGRRPFRTNDKDIETRRFLFFAECIRALYIDNKTNLIGGALTVTYSSTSAQHSRLH